MRTIVILVASMLLLAGCPRRSTAQRASPTPAAAAASSPSMGPTTNTVRGVLMGDGEHTIGEPIRTANLAVFPIYAEHQEDLGDFRTLEEGLEQKLAIVRELDTEVPSTRNQAPDPSNARPVQVRGPRHGGGASVNHLAIENHGKQPILVLAGTIVKGGNQDRQIGADTIVPAGATVTVDAFCVEPHRWTSSREGRATAGRFSTSKPLAHAKVRAAGQYEKEQSKVWNEVGKINASHGKAPSTGTLLSTLDDAQLTSERERLAKHVSLELSARPNPGAIVGIAYAVGSEVRAARWFFHHRVFERYREALVATAAAEAQEASTGIGTKTASPSSPGSTMKTAASTVGPEDVVRFVRNIEVATARAEEKAANVNELRETTSGWGSEVRLKSSSPGAAAGKRAVTKDFVKK